MRLEGNRAGNEDTAVKGQKIRAGGIFVGEGSEGGGDRAGSED